ncbi:MAG: GntR family transcriptional regulator [Planctomycetes bacterium]|nr:GntR family transcriptional regulator [Planctomycetota bacterium]
MSNQALSPIRRSTSLTKEVIDRLRQAILSGELEEGASLPEAQTAAKLGVSRVPVREALVELERQGLVEFDRNGRACVRAFTDDDVAELISLRAALQRMAARLAASKLTEGDVAALEDILNRARETQDLSAFSALDSEFHDQIVVIARHRRLQRLWADVRSQMELWLARIHRRRESTLHDVRQATLQSHREMIEVLKTRKPELAGDLMERHCSWKELPT